jgi:hypothetical protein
MIMIPINTQTTLSVPVGWTLRIIPSTNVINPARSCSCHETAGEIPPSVVGLIFVCDISAPFDIPPFKKLQAIGEVSVDDYDKG